MYISREPFWWNWASSVCYDAAVNKGSRDITFPMNGIHRAYRHWMHDYLAWKYFYMGVFRPKINVYVSPPPNRGGTHKKKY